jgi:hypothetical protein
MRAIIILLALALALVQISSALAQEPDVHNFGNLEPTCTRWNTGTKRQPLGGG